MKATYTVHCKRCFVKLKKVLNKKGNPITAPVEHRKMLLLDPNAFLDSGDYQITVKAAKDVPPIFCLSIVPRIKQPIFSNPSGKLETWYKNKPNKPDGSKPFQRSGLPMSQEEFLKWLSFKLGDKAKTALNDLLTVEPENDEDEMSEAA